MFHGYTGTLRIHLSRELLSLDILIFVKIVKEMILCVALWNASAEVWIKETSNLTSTVITDTTWPTLCGCCSSKRQVILHPLL